MPEQFTSALLTISWTSIVWAPLVMVGAAWMPRYRWHAVTIASALLTGLFGWSLLLSSTCRSLEDAEVILCREEGMAFGVLQLVIIGAALFASGFFILGQLVRWDAAGREVA